MTAVQIMYAVTTNQDIQDANMSVFMGLSTLTITHIHSETCQTATSVDGAATGVTATAVLYIPGAPSTDVWITEKDFNVISKSTVEGLDHTKMNVYRFTFSRWSTGAILFSILDSQYNGFTDVHQWSNIGFNTSIPYKPTIYVENNTCASVNTISTSMATISSGTPSTCTNMTSFSKAFAMPNVNLTSDRETVLFVFNTPMLVGSAHIVNRMTACVDSMTIGVSDTGSPLRIRIYLSALLSNIVPTVEHAGWSCVRHANAPPDTFAQYGLLMSSTYVSAHSIISQEVTLDQLWCTPGTNICITACAVNDPVTASMDLELKWHEV
jgi:hypothetical protein